jgi:tryptophan halogenase
MEEFETVRDFIILHYHANERDDSEFWCDMRNMEIPGRLHEKIEAFRASAAVFNDQSDIFRDASWIEVMLGQGIHPVDYHPAADALPDEELLNAMEKIWQAKQQPLPRLLGHDEFLQRYAAA